MKRILAFVAIVACLFALPSCKGKSDADLKTASEAALSANPDLTGVTVDVIDGVATISGEVTDPAFQTAAADAVKNVKGIKSVTNNTTLKAPPPPVQITETDALTTAIADAIKDHPNVSATVTDGVVTLTGDIKKDELKVLMQKVNATRPKKVDNSGLKVN